MDKKSSVLLTQDILSWYRVLDDEPPECEVLVETWEGFVVVQPSSPWPPGAWRWAELPRRVLAENFSKQYHFDGLVRTDNLEEISGDGEEPETVG